jgi:drug/metabolite transporter (DMT)-like permease
MPAGGPPPQVLTGILLAVGAGGLFAVLDAIAKYLATFYPTPMVAWARYFFHVLVMLAVLLPRWGWRLVATRHPRLQLARGIFLGLSSITFFAALARMPLAEATAIIAIHPVLVTLAAVRWLGEVPPRGTYVALAVSLAGVLLIIRPGSDLFGATALLPLMTVVFAAGYTLCTRRLAGRDDSMATLFIGGLVATAMLCLLLPFNWSPPQSWVHVLLFVCAGVVGAGGHLLLVRAFERASATTLAPYTYSHTVAALPVALIVFGTFPDGWALLGMSAIVATGVAMALMRGRADREARAERAEPS